MMDALSRTELLLGRAALEKLKRCRIAVFGVGGVGGYALEALARSGVGALDIVDGDEFTVTNLNRQLLATKKTLGREKAAVAAERVSEIAPDCSVRAYNFYYRPETESEFDFHNYDYIIDAIDMVTGKLALIKNAYVCGTPIVSSMGTGNKLDPTRFEIADLAETSVCPLARVMRRELKKINIEHLPVVYSKEKPIKIAQCECEPHAVGSISFVPAVAGLLLASKAITDLIGKDGN